MSLTRVPAALGGLALAGAVFVNVSAPQAQVLGPPPTPASPVATVKPTPWICGFTCVAPTYLKASNYSSQFGQAVALSRDGKTLAIGAPEESSAGIGVDGAQTPYTGYSSGAVYVFARDGFGWRQQAYIKASNAEAYDRFGSSVALSADGNTLAVGAYTERGGVAGVGGDQSDNSVLNSGAVYVFTRSAESPTFGPPVHWTQSAYIKASNPDEHDFFGSAVALSSNGATLAVSAPPEDSRATGIDGDQIDDSELTAGAVYVFRIVRGVWTQEAYVKASNTDSADAFGGAIAISADGDTLAVGAIGEDSSAIGIDGPQSDEAAAKSGAVYVFKRTGGLWAQEAYVKASNTEAGDEFGASVALGAGGNVLAVGARREDGSGAAYVFTRSAATWSQRDYVKASNAGSGDHFGESIALSTDGEILAVGAGYEDSGARGVNGNQGDDFATGEGSGAAYLFIRANGSWSQMGYFKPTNTERFQWFGSQISLAGSGRTLAVGSLFESSNAIGVNGTQTNSDARHTGSAYVFFGI